MGLATFLTVAAASMACVLPSVAGHAQQQPRPDERITLTGTVTLEELGDIPLSIRVPSRVSIPILAGRSVHVSSAAGSLDVGHLGLLTLADIVDGLDSAARVATAFNISLEQAVTGLDSTLVAGMDAGVLSEEDAMTIAIVAAIVQVEAEAAHEEQEEGAWEGEAQQTLIAVPPGETPGLRQADAQITWYDQAGCGGVNSIVTGPAGFCNVVPNSNLLAGYRVNCAEDGGSGVFQVCLRVDGFECQQCIDAVRFTSDT